MPPRVTRSSARLAQSSSAIDDSPPADPAPASAPTPLPPSTRKRKATVPAASEASPTEAVGAASTRKKARLAEPNLAPPNSHTPTHLSSTRRGKASSAAAMSGAGNDDGDHARSSAAANRRRQSPASSEDASLIENPSTNSSRRRSSRRKSGQGLSRSPLLQELGTDPTPAALNTSSTSSRKTSRKSSLRKDKEADASSSKAGVEQSLSKAKAEQDDDGDVDDDQQDDGNNNLNNDDDDDDDDEDDEDNDEAHHAGALERAEHEAAARRYQQEEEDDDPFSGGFLSRSGMPSGLSSTLRAITDMMSGTTSRLRGILENLRAKDDPSVQMIALTELSEILLVSNEDNLAGHFAPDQYVKELVALMQPNDFGEENPEMMLLACRCIANLMEALPAATASVVYGGAVPVLCQKLLEIHYIDLAEQALSTLEKISVEFPSSIVREGGLTACLTYLDFFATSTQRTAVTTAANCCRNIPDDSFPVVRDVMPILLNVLGSNDQRVVEQGSLCVSRVIESFRYHETKLEELVSPDLLRAILRLLLPGTTNMIGPNIHTQFLRVLSITARQSPRLAVELLRMNVVDTLYQILTGVSPPSGTEGMATKIDKNIIMQALIRTPRDQIFETLNVICEILPSVERDNLMFLDDITDAGYTGAGSVSMATQARRMPNDKRLELLRDCQPDVRRFAIILFPTLMHAYTSTVNLGVRQKVLTAQLKMLSNFDTAILRDALADVTYASHLASILTQQENPALVTFALQVAELLLKRLESIYRPQFYREGVMAEISKLAQRPITTLPPNTASKSAPPSESSPVIRDPSRAREDGDDEPDYPNEEGSEGEANEDEHNGQDDEHDEDDETDGSSVAEPGKQDQLLVGNIQDIVTTRSRRFIEVYGAESDSGMQIEASKVLTELRSLAQDLRSCYASHDITDGPSLFGRLARYFENDAHETITSYELLTSGIVETLLAIFTGTNEHFSTAARSAFLEAFMSMGQLAKTATGSANSPATAFSVLAFKLQDLLSRTEHFEVITVHQNAFDSSRSSAASMLAKQLRIKLSADEDSGIPRPYRNIMVSIHAIATFRALDDYLRPRISFAEQAVNAREARGALTNSLGRAASGRGDLGNHEASGAPSAQNPTTGRTNASATTKSSRSEGTSKDTSGSLRRSSRRLTTQDSSAENDSGAAPQEAAEDNQQPLECADEAPLSDEDEENEAALDAIVDDFEEDMDEDTSDPSAVNLEVANTGTVTARREDGTRVSTPLQTSQSSAASRLSASGRLAAARAMLSTPTSRSRPSSYASALQAISQDWHIEFSVDGQQLANDTTIYRAVHFNQSNPDEISSRNIWSTLHKISFRRVPGPPSAESSLQTVLSGSAASDGSGLPPSLSQHPVTASILRLMSILHEMNANLDDVVVDKQGTLNLSAEPLAQFVNTKLTAKLNRQLEEPLIVASNCLPTWSEDLARLYPFLFPFETRHLFLQSTSFGYSRSMTRWQNAQAETSSRRQRDERPFLGRLQRQKVRISRTRILESAVKVMELYGSSPSILEVEYFEEVGTGLGPTLEFYSTVSKEFSKKKTKLWRENESGHRDEYAFGIRGLFPAPMSEEQAKNENGQRVLHLFKMLGKFVARSMLDSRIIDVSFNPTFFRIGDGDATITPSLGAVASVDKDLASSLKHLMLCAKAKRAIDEDVNLSPLEKVEAARQIKINDIIVEDLGLDFTLPGYPSIELQPGGSNIDVTIDNVQLYVNKVIDFTLGCGVQRQVDAFRSGFSQVFPYSALRAFTPDELVMLFGRAEEDWSLETLMDSVKADHGFNLDSQSVHNLLQTMSEYGLPERRDFLQFVTGSPKLPIGGFKSLTPMFTVVCKPSEPPLTSDDYLPSVMTCVNYLKMPNYSSAEVLRAKLGVAIKEGAGAFHLS